MRRPVRLPCAAAMLEAWSVAPLRARVYAALYLLLQLMSLAGCCVAFGAPLFYAQSADELASDSPSPAPRYHFYHDHLTSSASPSTRLPFSYLDRLSGSNHCAPGGRVLVAFSSLSFLLLLSSLLLSTLRLLSTPLPSLPHPRQSLLLELSLLSLSSPLYLISLTSYASMCYHHIFDSAAFVDTRATGFAYHIAGFFAQLLAVGVGLVVRRDEESWLGVGGDGRYGVTRGKGVEGGMRKETTGGREGRAGEEGVGKDAAPDVVVFDSRVGDVSYQQSDEGTVADAGAPVQGAAVAPAMAPLKGKRKPKARNYAAYADRRQLDYATYSYQAAEQHDT